MISRRKMNLITFAFFVALLLNIMGLSLVTHAASKSTAALQGSTSTPLKNKDETQPAAFMHRPFYGNQTVTERTTSFFDHDKPWYENDGTFVRYDGKTWLNTPIGTCVAGENCYDGHNGYDLNMYFEPLLSTAAGTITRAGWYDPMDHSDGFGLWIAIDHGNGYATAYGHLSGVAVVVGQRVGIQQRIGTTGTTGASTGPHLHMGTYYLPNWQPTDPFGWSGNYPNPNVVPDHYLWVNQPGSSSTVPLLSISGNKLYPGATQVDDASRKFSKTGTWQTAIGINNIKGTMHWSATTDGAATATATWKTRLTKSRYYEVGFFVDDNHASSSWVPITVTSAVLGHPGVATQHLIHVDESRIGTFVSSYGTVSTGAQWISLGTFYFNKGMDAKVVVSNATGEAGQQLGVDGVEFAPLS